MVEGSSEASAAVWALSPPVKAVMRMRMRGRPRLAREGGPAQTDGVPSSQAGENAPGENQCVLPWPSTDMDMDTK